MKSFKKIAIAFGSLALGVGVIGAVASANGQKNLQQAQAGTQTETVATIDLTADHSLTATTTPWRISGYAGFNSKTSSYYLGGTKATDGAVITYCPTTNPFANVPTQITMTVTGRAVQTLEAGAGSTGDYSKKTVNLYAVDSSGAKISASATTGTTPVYNSTTILDGSFSVTSTLTNAYGIAASFITTGKYLLITAVSVSYTYATTDPEVSITTSGSIKKGTTGTLAATTNYFSGTPTLSWSSASTGVITITDAATGAYSAVAAGTSVITVTATYNTETATANVTLTVIEPTLTLGNLFSGTFYTTVGDTGTMSITATNFSGTPTYAWTSSDASVFKFTDAATGAYSGVALGTTTISVTATYGTDTATATANISVISLAKNVTFLSGNMNLPSAVSATDASCKGSDCYVLTANQVKNDSGYIHFSPSNAGYLYNTTEWAGTISRIILRFGSSNAIANSKFAVTAGTAANPSTGATIVSNSDNTYHYCDVSAAAGTYFKIANNGTDDLKIYSMQVETASDEISEFVTYIAGKSTGDATTGVTDATTCAANYKAAKQMILYMSAAAITDFKASTDTDTVTARTRYVNWCTANGDASPWSGTIVGGSANLIKSNSTDNGTIVYVVLGAIAVAAFGGYLFLRKKKENA